MNENARILIVDDNASNRKALSVRLTAAGYEVIEASDGPTALEKARSEAPDLVLLDIVMPHMDGYEVCRRLKEDNGTSFVPVIMVTAKSESQALVKALQQGADEYVTRPFDPLELNARIHSMLRIRRMYQENIDLKQQIASQHRFDELLGQSPAMKRLLDTLSKVIESQVTVLLSGESGTGKETVARTIHYKGPRQKARFVAVNCGALAPGLLESELFGHKKGAFTGAIEDRPGLFKAADGGTLFLDEIAETSADMQVKLLRAIQEGEITRVGESESQPVDVRIIAASNRDLEQAVETGTFREDLFYRLSVFPIRLPPLRDRREDIPLLARHFLEIHAPRADKETTGFTSDALDALCRHTWPGNVRELENEIERALVLVNNGEAIALEMLSEKLRPQTDKRPWRRDGKLKDILSQVEREVIEEAFTTCLGNKSRMAEYLGMNRSTLLQRMSDYRIG